MTVAGVGAPTNPGERPGAVAAKPPSEWRRLKRLHLLIFLLLMIPYTLDRLTGHEPHADLGILLIGWIAVTIPLGWACLQVWRLRVERPRRWALPVGLFIGVGGMGTLIALLETGVWTFNTANLDAWCSWAAAVMLGTVWITEEKKSVRIYYAAGGTLLYLPGPGASSPRSGATDTSSPGI